MNETYFIAVDFLKSFTFFSAIAFFMIFICVFQVIGSGEIPKENESRLVKKASAISLLFVIPAAGIFALPTAKDIAKIRINLLKAEVAKAENVEKAAARIDEIMRKIEKKYLED